MREKLIKGWSDMNPALVRENGTILENWVRNVPSAERGKAVAYMHPTLLGQLFNALLDGVLVNAVPHQLCKNEPPHHEHDGRYSCELATLAESYRVPYV
jgi:hypothetical protein